MKYFDWDELKNAKLKAERGICFEDIVTALQEGNLLEVTRHPGVDKYPNQMMYAVKINHYVYMVPFVEDDEKFFLKTIFASRKMTKKYLQEGGKS